MRQIFFLLVCLLLLAPRAATLASSGDADLSLAQGSISFSKETLIVGDTVRIYATIKNVGDVDVSGYVSFYQGSLPIGDSQVISLRAGGLPEEVYVDFVVPSGSFNIRAEIRGTDPQDNDDSNNSLFTQLYTPILDDDRDGIENKDDNCPTKSNPDQADNDVDGLGDVCDDDDDNDGLTDDVERELSTDPKSSDTDGDGIPDATDLHPTIPESQIVVETTIIPITEPTTPVPTLLDSETEESDDTASTFYQPAVSNVESGEEEPEVTPETIADLIISPSAIFTYQKISWNTYNFKVQLPEIDGYRVTWDFGDNVTSTKEEVEHVYEKAGDFTVKVFVESSGGQVAEDSVVIHVPFLVIENRLVQFLIAVLSFVLVILIILFFRTGKNSLPSPTKTKSTPISSGPHKISVRDED